ncbi:MAG: Ig-like domain-containing protein, partial [Candidatus Izemoplasmatales bacterium]|nr:Ig-like domain-containing protein [Candidatus Izemoplasmatales bacterium]
FTYTGDSSVVIDNLSLRELLTVPDNPFDPTKTYYEGSNLLGNGDFEAFAVDTVFSEAQLEGAWGSVSLDGPATIKSVDSSKVMSIGKTDGKMYSSAFVITPPELEVGDLVRLSYDFKLDLVNNVGDYAAIDTCFVGASNTSYYKINLANITDGALTSGAELLQMPVVLTDLGNGWFNVTLDIQVTTQLLVKCNSIRFLFTPIDSADALYIDNVKLAYLTDTEPEAVVTSISITEGDQNMVVGDEVTLTAVATPTNATNNTIVWSSSNEAVATVDQTGKVTAIGKGACSITASTADNSVSTSIVATVVSPTVEPSGLPVGWIITIATFGVIVVAGGAFFLLKSKKTSKL